MDGSHPPTLPGGGGAGTAAGAEAGRAGRRRVQCGQRLAGGAEEPPPPGQAARRRLPSPWLQPLPQVYLPEGHPRPFSQANPCLPGVAAGEVGQDGCQDLKDQRVVAGERPEPTCPPALQLTNGSQSPGTKHWARDPRSRIPGVGFYLLLQGLARDRSQS